MTAYCLFDNVEVLDPDGLAEYVAQVHRTVERYGGRYLAVGGEVETREGASLLTYPVLMAFPDLETARRWHDSEEYLPLKALRQRSVRANATFFESGPSELLSGIA